MKTKLFYFSATGNSLKAAKDLAEKLGNTELLSIPKQMNKPIDLSADRIGLIFPVYAWGLPLILINFIKKLHGDKQKYIFAIATCGGSTGSTLIQVKKLLDKQGLNLKAGFKMQMPGNYTPLYEAIPEEKQKLIFDNEKKEISEIAGIVKEGKQGKIFAGSFLSNLILSGIIYKLFKCNVRNSYKSFWVDDKCDSCGICEKVCPVKNIRMKNNKPEWFDRCEQCLACLQWCPKEAIQFGKKTSGRKRYHHPDIKVSEIYR